MELTKLLGLLAVVLPAAYGAPVADASNLQPKVLEAMKRDLGLNGEQASARIAREIKASEVIEHLRTASGDAFAGAWVADNGKTIHVGVTDQAAADKVSAAGAKPTIMANKLSKLQEAKSALDKIHKDQARTKDSNYGGIAAYHVDVAANKLVIKALKGSNAHAADLAAQVGLSASEFKVVTVSSMPKPFVSVSGGDAYLINNSARCSVGFSVTTGFVSAGHCGQQGASVTTQSGEALGTFEGSVFPGDADMSYISTVEGTDLTANIAGADQPVTGSAQAPVGSSICRSGSTTGVHCGTVNSFDASVNYPEGTITGLTETDACAEPGDSGGSFYSGGDAQGVTSGGSGDCTNGGTTYFQPVGEILDTYGLTLITA